MGIDTSKIRVGDEVFMQGAVSDIRSDYFVIDGRYAVRGKDIVAHHPKPREIKAGDMVTGITMYGDKAWRVLHVHDGKAWLDGYGIYPVSSLRHAD